MAHLFALQEVLLYGIPSRVLVASLLAEVDQLVVHEAAQNSISSLRSALLLSGMSCLSPRPCLVLARISFV